MTKTHVPITRKAASTALRAIETAFDDIDFNIEYFTGPAEKRTWERDLRAAERVIRRALGDQAMTTLHVVKLYPYDDASEARYQFDRKEDAQAFADRVNKLPRETLRYVTGTGKPTPVEPWETSTYDTVEQAWEDFAENIPECRHDHVDLAMDALDPARERLDAGAASTVGRTSTWSRPRTATGTGRLIDAISDR